LFLVPAPCDQARDVGCHGQGRSPAFRTPSQGFGRERRKRLALWPKARGDDAHLRVMLYDN